MDLLRKTPMNSVSVDNESKFILPVAPVSIFIVNCVIKYCVFFKVGELRILYAGCIFLTRLHFP